MNSKVSVIVTTYNHEKWVKEALDSVAAQTYKDIGLFINDDCSTDGTRDIISKWVEDHPEIQTTVHFSPVNEGKCAYGLNRGLDWADGKYISTLAGDDVYLPDKLQTQVDIMNNLPKKVGVIYSDAYCIDEEGLPKHYFIRYHGITFIPRERDLFPFLSIRNWIPGISPLVRKSCYNKVGQYDTNTRWEDWDMWLRISRRYEFAYLPTTVVKYRFVNTSITAKQDEKEVGYWFCLSLIKFINDKSKTHRDIIKSRLGSYLLRMKKDGHPKFDEFFNEYKEQFGEELKELNVIF